MKPIKKYRDLDLNFTPHPITRRLLTLTDTDAVRRSIVNLVLTNNYERFFQPDIGSNVTSFLFSPSTTPFTARQIESAVESVIQTYEPRVQIVSVKAKLDLDLNGFDVEIVVTVKTIPDPVTIDLFLERTR